MTVGVHCAPKRWKPAGFSLIWFFTGTKFWLIKSLTRVSGYTSASSRAHPLHIGAALKSRKSGLWACAASRRAASTLVFQETGMRSLLAGILAPGRVSDAAGKDRHNQPGTVESQSRICRLFSPYEIRTNVLLKERPASGTIVFGHERATDNHNPGNDDRREAPPCRGAGLRR